MDNESLKSLKNIERILAELKVKVDTDEIMGGPNKTMNKIEAREEYSVQQIQTSFDRIHDKVFNFNNITLGIFLVLGTFPQEKPIVPIWSVIFPLLILIFMIFLDWRQMEIHRFASRETKWTHQEREEFADKVRIQALLSLWGFAFSFFTLFTLFLILIQY